MVDIPVKHRRVYRFTDERHDQLPQAFAVSRPSDPVAHDILRKCHLGRGKAGEQHQAGNTFWPTQGHVLRELAAHAEADEDHAHERFGTLQRLLRLG